MTPSAEAEARVAFWDDMIRRYDAKSAACRSLLDGVNRHPAWRVLGQEIEMLCWSTDRHAHDARKGRAQARAAMTRAIKKERAS